MKKTNLYIGVTFCLLAPIAAFAQGITFDESKWDEVLAKAKKDNKLIFMDAYTSWCGPCKMLANQVFPMPVVGAFFNANFVNVHYDMEKGEGTSLAQRYNVNMYPTLIVIDGTGKEVERTAGFMQGAALIDFGKRALMKRENVADWAAKYEAGDKSEETLRRYATALRRTEASSAKIANEYIATQKNMSTPDNLRFLLDVLERIDSKVYDLILQNKDKLSLLDNATGVKDKIKAACENTARIATEFKSIALLQQAQAAMKKQVGGSDAKRFELTSNMAFFKATKEEAAYVKAATKYANNVIGKDVAKLFELAQTFEQDVKTPANLKKALPWAKKAHETYPKYEHSLLYANLLLKTGDQKNAHAIAEKALEIGKKQGTFTGQAQQIFDSTK